jgi:hypothetical protein
MRATVCEVCAEGRAAMDAGNDVGREAAASLAGAGEDAAAHLARPRRCADSLLGEGLGVLGGRGLWCVLLGTRLEGLCVLFGYACGRGMGATVCEWCVEGGGDGCRPIGPGRLRCMRRPVLFCQSPAILGRESGWAAPVTLPRCLPCDTGACQWPRERRSAGPHAAVRAAAASDQVRHQPASTVPSISTHLACARAASRMGCCSHPD